MIEYIISLCFITTIGTVYVTKQINEKLTNHFTCWFALCLIFPILEEIVFRGVLKKILYYCPYGNHINCLLFGLAHLINYKSNSNINAKYYLAYQTISTIFLGFYLINLDDIYDCIIVHTIYNTIPFICCVLYSHCYILDNNKVTDFKSVYIPAKTQDDCYLHFKQHDKKFINIAKDKIPVDIINRRNLLQQNIRITDYLLN
jgi:hypothetical protein